MDTFLTFLLTGAVALYFLRGYLRKLAPNKTASKHSDAVTRQQRTCPRCGKLMNPESAFCQHCGAALAMWTIHQAATNAVPVPSAAEGQPRPIINASLCIGCASCVHECPETGTLAMEQGKAILAHPERCVGHKKCVEVCPTQALTLTIGDALQTLRVPLVRENFETNVDGIFIAGELSGMGLIKTAINEGKLLVDHLRQRIRDSPASYDGYDVAIVGAGPAGLSASLTAQQYGLRYITLEQGEIASTIRQYPRQKFLMAEPIEIPLYGNLYVGDGSKETLLAVWETIIANTGVQIHTGEKVEAVRRNSAGFVVTTACGEYHARYVVLALGKRGSPRKLGVAGEELPKVSYKLIEADTYASKKLLVVGGGDSAVEAALALSRSSSNQVVLSYRGQSLHRVRERNRDLLRTAESAGAVKVLFNSEVKTITPDAVELSMEGRSQVLANDFVFVLIGGEPPEEFLTKCGVQMVEKTIGQPRVKSG